MEHSQTAVSVAGHIPNGQGQAGYRQVSLRACDEAPSSRPVAMVALSKPEGGNAVRYCSLGRNLTPWSSRELEFLEANYRDMTFVDIGKVIGRTTAAVKHKAMVLGYRKPRILRGGNHKMTWEPQKRAQGSSERAADFLRGHDRVGMWRCDEDGSANPDGAMWRYGNAILTDDEVTAKATRKGWDEHEWRRIA